MDCLLSLHVTIFKIFYETKINSFETVFKWKLLLAVSIKNKHFIFFATIITEKNIYKKESFFKKSSWFFQQKSASIFLIITRTIKIIVIILSYILSLRFSDKLLHFHWVFMLNDVTKKNAENYMLFNCTQRENVMQRETPD